VLALFFNSIPNLARLFSEVIEEIDTGPGRDDHVHRCPPRPDPRLRMRMQLNQCSAAGTAIWAIVAMV
jgi:hypothetical protein